MKNNPPKNNPRYANGSLRAVGYLADKKTGQYDMYDVLKLR